MRGGQFGAGARGLCRRWGEVIRDEDRPTVKNISLQHWSGLLWAGQWEHHAWLPLPAGAGTRTGKNGGDAEETE